MITLPKTEKLCLKPINMFHIGFMMQKVHQTYASSFNLFGRDWKWVIFTKVSTFWTELFYDRGNHHEFTSLVKELAKPGEFTTKQSFDFEFVNVEKPFETYTGANVRLR